MTSDPTPGLDDLRRLLEPGRPAPPDLPGPAAMPDPGAGGELLLTEEEYRAVRRNAQREAAGVPLQPYPPRIAHLFEAPPAPTNPHSGC